MTKLLTAFISLDTEFRTLLVEPGTYLIVSLMFALAAAVSATLCLRRRKRHDRSRLSPNFWYLAATAVGLFLVYVVRTYLWTDDPTIPLE